MGQYAESVVLSSKGQIVIPAKLRKRLKIKRKDRLIVTEERGGILLKPVVRLSSLKGIDKGLGISSKVVVSLRENDKILWQKKMKKIEKMLKTKK